MKTVLIGAILLVAGLLVLGATRRDEPNPAEPRSYRMGFGSVPPKADLPTALRNLDEWSKHSDAAVDHRDVPWKSLLGEPGSKPTRDDLLRRAEAYVEKEVMPLMAYYRQKRYVVACTVDAADGIDRAKEARELREMGRSVAEPEVQEAYVVYVETLARRVKPEYIGLVSEANVLAEKLPKGAAAGLVKMAAEAADRVKSVSPNSVPYVSTQVEWAWGKFGAQPGYQGCERLFRDYPFVRALGVSSYPAFGWPEPEQIPREYFSRLLSGRKMPILMVEGGWPSTTVGPLASEPDKQSRWMRRLETVLDTCHAEFVGLLFYADLDLATYPQFEGTILPFFATMGLAHSDWKPKPVLKEWDRVFARPRAGGGTPGTAD